MLSTAKKEVGDNLEEAVLERAKKAGNEEGRLEMIDQGIETKKEKETKKGEKEEKPKRERTPEEMARIEQNVERVIEEERREKIREIIIFKFEHPSEGFNDTFRQECLALGISEDLLNWKPSNKDLNELSRKKEYTTFNPIERFRDSITGKDRERITGEEFLQQLLNRFYENEIEKDGSLSSNAEELNKKFYALLSNGYRPDSIRQELLTLKVVIEKMDGKKEVIPNRNQESFIDQLIKKNGDKNKELARERIPEIEENGKKVREEIKDVENFTDLLNKLRDTDNKLFNNYKLTSGLKIEESINDLRFEIGKLRNENKLEEEIRRAIGRSENRIKIPLYAGIRKKVDELLLKELGIETRETTKTGPRSTTATTERGGSGDESQGQSEESGAGTDEEIPVIPKSAIVEEPPKDKSNKDSETVENERKKIEEEGKKLKKEIKDLGDIKSLCEKLREEKFPIYNDIEIQIDGNSVSIDIEKSRKSIVESLKNEKDKTKRRKAIKNDDSVLMLPVYGGIKGKVIELLEKELDDMNQEEKQKQQGGELKQEKKPKAEIKDKEDDFEKDIKAKFKKCDNIFQIFEVIREIYSSYSEKIPKELKDKYLRSEDLNKKIKEIFDSGEDSLIDELPKWAGLRKSVKKILKNKK